MVTMEDVTKALSNWKIDDDNVKNALLINDVFQVDGNDNQGFVSVFESVLVIENRNNTNMWVALAEDEFWQIVRFALENGLKLPQNEDENND